MSTRHPSSLPWRLLRYSMSQSSQSFAWRRMS